MMPIGKNAAAAISSGRGPWAAQNTIEVGCVRFSNPQAMPDTLGGAGSPREVGQVLPGLTRLLPSAVFGRGDTAQ
jgi:hypothetical protein